VTAVVSAGPAPPPSRCLAPEATDLRLPVAAAAGGCGCSPPLPNSSRPHVNGTCDAPATGHGRKRSPTRSVGSAPSRTQADRKQPGEDPGRRGCRRCRSPRPPTSSRATDGTVATGAHPMRRAGRLRARTHTATTNGAATEAATEHGPHPEPAARTAADGPGCW
jgi:hypothetical protein